MLERWNDAPDVGPYEAHWHQATIERDGTALGDIAPPAVEETATMSCVSYASTRLSGIIIAQIVRVIGQGGSLRSAEPTSGQCLGLFPRPGGFRGDDLAMRDGAYRRFLQLRAAAQAALVRLGHADRYRRVVAHAPRPACIDLVRGTQVFNWRSARTHRNLKGRRIRVFERWLLPVVFDHVRLATRMEQLLFGAVA